jgi:membrane-bound metal-dependent hydrolase YbcI (DUF457 family)
LFSVLPDLDVFIMPLRRYIKSNYLDHRAGSHSYIIGIILSAIIGGIYSSITRKPFLIAWIIGISFYGLHVSMDLLTTTKIPYLFPLSKKEHYFYVEKAGSLFTMINSVIFIILSMSFYAGSVEIIILRTLFNIYTAFFILYYIYRIILRVWFGSKLDDNQKYFPGVLPFQYTIYSNDFDENEISLSIEKKSHFSRNNTTINIKSVLNAEEMALFEKGMEVCNENYYYAKWTKLPIFIRDDETLSVRLFFLETMMQRRTMYIQFDFNKASQQLTKINRDSGRIQ